ncbi:MAG: SRPBCC family protein [Mycobacteriaceae bacterium]|nr:SRPBCC family protein [Mycobacteriaceae bacterium]
MTAVGRLPALSDLPADPLPNVLRFETTPPDDARPILMERVHSVYPHEQIYGPFCPVQDYIAAPPRAVFEYLADPRSLEEWTYSLRGFTETEEPGLWVALDLVGSDDTKIFTRAVAHPDAMTVDYHCAWDQSEHLWMIYLMRVVDAQVVLDKPGCVVTWSNCKHPFYDENPWPELAPEGRELWVGDGWELFPAGHALELRNLKTICEYRAAHGISIKPDWMK